MDYRTQIEKRAIKSTESLEMRLPRPKTRKKTYVYVSSAHADKYETR